MVRICYIDTFSGVAGDMLLAALIDAGAGLEEIKLHMNSIKDLAGEWDLKVSRVYRGSGRIAASYATVTSLYDHKPAPVPINLIDYISEKIVFGHSHQHANSLDGLLHNHTHSHDDMHSHNHGDRDFDEMQRTSNDKMLRNYETIRSLISNSGLPDTVKDKSIAVFHTLAVAESETHGVDLNAVHFHEVGAIDSIIDTIGVVLALHLLGIEQCFCSPLPLSSGTVWTAHGLLPVPAPATLRLMLGIPTCPGPKFAHGELVTPTGASLVKVLCSPFGFGKPPNFLPKSIGIGAGTKDFEKHPNILRVIIGDLLSGDEEFSHLDTNALEKVVNSDLESSKISIDSVSSNEVIDAALNNSQIGLDSAQKDIKIDCNAASKASKNDTGKGFTESELIVLETNIDDVTGELMGHATSKLLTAGALDVWMSPMYMKKCRPAHTLHVLCEPSQRDELAGVIFSEGLTLGIRSYPVSRLAISREIFMVSTKFGDIRVKVGTFSGQIVSQKPEFDDCHLASKACNVPLKTVIDEALQQWHISVKNP